MTDDDEPVWMSPEMTCVYFLHLFCEDEDPELSAEQNAMNKARIRAALDAAKRSGFTQEERLLALFRAHERNERNAAGPFVDMLKKMFLCISPMDFLAAGGFHASNFTTADGPLH